MSVNQFEDFLKNLGYPEELLNAGLKENVFIYRIDIFDPDIMDFPTNRLDLIYVYTPTEESIFETHSNYWNQNSVNAFIAISDNNCYIINAREKPDEEHPLSKNIRIKTFDYGVNSKGFEKDKLKEISKDAVDSTYFFDFVSENQKTTHEVDKDLLLNLIALRNDLEIEGNEKIAYSLILKCLFLKYLEDRGIYEKDYLLDILRGGKPGELINAFKEIQKINGDIFKQDEIAETEITHGYMEKLSIFFSCDYQSRQRKLFPYRFDKIPVQLISSVYEAFLRSEEKRGKGIYYTPSFIVNFMLSHTLKEKLSRNPRVTVLDPACGSGAFLVESFKMIIDALPQKPNFKEKQEILLNQLFGIDRDENSLQIAAFSLYLVLLETESPEYIHSQIEHAHPILPSLIGKTLIKGNALVNDELFKGKTFDCIIANPPWGSVPDDGDVENIEERKAIGTKGNKGTKPEYVNVSDYERSQAFLLRAGQWGTNESIFSMVVKNSIFLNENAGDFRKELLKKYSLSYFYELSNLNKILFKKRSIGKVAGTKIEIGAVEPCAIIVFSKSKYKTNTIKYVAPKLTGFSEKFRLIHFSQKDVARINQTAFLEDDIMWRILVNGTIDDVQLIKKLREFQKNSIDIECRSGFQPKKDMSRLGPPIIKKLVEPADFSRYFLKHKLKNFNWNQELRRGPDEKIFHDGRILVPVRPLKSDNLMFRGIRMKQNIIHKHNVLCIKLKQKTNGKYVEDYAPYLAIINSRLLGYYFYHISSQWGKGEDKRDTLRNIDVEKLPVLYLDFSDDRVAELGDLVHQVEQKKKEMADTSLLEDRIDDLVFSLYGLLEFEQEIIREFYQTNVERKKDTVKNEDIQNYVNRFRKNFNFFLDKNYRLNAYYSISLHMGAAVCFQIVKKEDFIRDIPHKEISLLNIVKKSQLQQSFTSRMVNEDKVKIYDKNKFYIVKSNYFKDWTERQALKDANEEIGLLLKNLPEKNNIG